MEVAKEPMEVEEETVLIEGWIIRSTY